MACNSISYTSFIANIKIVNIFFPYFIHMFYPQSIMAEFIRTHYTPYDNQYGARALARKYGVHHSVIERIVHNKAWWSNPKGKG